jgi:uncharacterized protein YndB with AHSA1/START domain
MSSKFVYVTYIRTTPDELWRALTEPQMTRQYWFGVAHETSWLPGTPWRMTFADGRVADSGEIVAVEPRRRIALRWQNQFVPELKAEGHGRCTIEMEDAGDSIRLTVQHEMPQDDSKVIASVAVGWPRVLASLKSLVETGAALDAASNSNGAQRDAAEIGRRPN